jgi:hypothetical protein
MMADRNSTIEKIKALLSKTTASGCSEAEMLSALAMAKAWQNAHEISDAELQLSREEKVLLHRESGKDVRDPHQIKWQLCSGIARYCNVHPSLRSKANGGGISFIGAQSDIETATWLVNRLADFVHDELFKFLLDCLAPEGNALRKEIRSFVDGCTKRIVARMIEMCKQAEPERTSSGTALVVIKDQAIKDFIKAEGLRFRSLRGSQASVSDGAWAAGQSAGDRANFGRPVSGAGAMLRIGKA